jgi:type IV pilus assembly protein PilY1
MVVGSGPVGYDFLPQNTSNTQTSRFYAWNLKTGVKEPIFATSDAKSFMGNLLSVDVDLDYRVDSLYGGTVMCNTAASICDTGVGLPVTILPVPPNPKWKGKMYRLTTMGCTGVVACNSTPWGGAPHIPTVLTSTFSCATGPPCTGATLVGPISAQPSATRDDSNKIWLFFGTGRYFDTLDKTNSDIQHFIGIKDPVLSGSCTQSSATNCERNNLLNVTNAAVCIVCTGNEVTGVTGATTFQGLIDKIKGDGSVANPGTDGWYMAMTAGERVVTPTTVVAGLVFFPSFTPVSDMCSDSGNSTLYALYYRTGSAPLEPVIGTTGTTNMVVNKTVNLGSGGVASQVSIQIGAQGSGGVGGGCSGRLTGYIQASSGALTSFCISGSKPWSKYVSWVNDRT